MKLLLLGLSLLSLNIFACSCMEWTDAAQMLKQADSVVIAAPIGKSEFFSSGEYADIVMTPMKVVKHYKGKYKNRIHILSEKGDGANCGLQFKKYDGLFLIFSYKYNNKYYMTSMCDTGYITPDNLEVSEIINQLESL